MNETDRVCAWCLGPIRRAARRDSIYCGKSCRQAAHRFRRGAFVPKPPPDRPMRFAYADPPYPGLSDRYYEGHPDHAGEVDHDQLLEDLRDGYPDGWALSTNARSLPRLLRSSALPDDVWVAAWFRGARPSRSAMPLQTWEPVIVRGGRQLPPEHGSQRRHDALCYVARARPTDNGRVTGAKPAEFLWWAFALLGACAGDQLDDLFPGSGGVARAWSILQEGAPTPDHLAGYRELRDITRSPRDASTGPADAAIIPGQLTLA